MSKNQTVSSNHIRLGKKTYFFDVCVTSQDKKYLKITESRFVEEGKPRVYNSLILFPEDLLDFQASMTDAVLRLKS